MRTAFVIFEGMTALDFIGVYDPLTRLKSMDVMANFGWEVCALYHDVSDDKGLQFVPGIVAEPLVGYDLVVIPGGVGTRHLQYNKVFIDWIKTARSTRLKASVCTGSLLLGAAGFLKGKRATTHPKALEELAPYCARVINERIVDEGDVVTARGVTSSIDLGLYLVERVAGADARLRIAKQMDYWEETNS